MVAWLNEDSAICVASHGMAIIIIGEFGRYFRRVDQPLFKIIL
jgi:hypothetical protein